MFRPIILFLTGNNNALSGKAYDCDYSPVSTQDEPLPPHLHPLLIPMIVAKISGHLPVNDLLNCRLVCQLWRAEILPILQSKLRHVRIHPRKMLDFLKVFRRSQDLPLQSLSFYADHSEHIMHMGQVTQVLFPMITSLRLHVAGQEIPNLPKILHNLTSLKEFVLLRIPEKSLPPSYRRYETLEEDLILPQLTSLSFGNSQPNQPFICNYDNFITEIINSAENLVSLEFQHWKSSLQQILRFGEFPASLEKLGVIGTSLKESEVATLKKKHLRLKHLTITLGPSIRDSTLEGFFETFEDSLEILDIVYDGPHATFPVQNHLPHLNTLRFHGWMSRITLDDFVEQFPSLESVELLGFQFIGYTDYDQRRRGKGRLAAESKVTTIVAKPCAGDDLAEMNIACLVQAFPNATRFKGFFFTDNMCELIFKYWPKLEYLCLDNCSRVTDFGFTGIPVEVLWADSQSEGPLVCKCDDLSRASQSRINPYIGNLQALKFLYLKGSGYFTNASLHYGILQLGKLQELELPQVDFPWCIECIAKLQQLRRLYMKSLGETVTMEDLVFLRKRIPTLSTVYSSAKGHF